MVVLKQLNVLAKNNKDFSIFAKAPTKNSRGLKYKRKNMGNYLVRVQLNPETNQSYTMLRNGLIKLGFTKRITDTSNIEWRLPNGNYYITTNNEKEWVINAVQSIALKINKNPMIVVAKVETKGLIWSGLEKC